MIGVIDRVLPDDLIIDIEKLITTTGWKYGWRSNNSLGYGHWNQDFGKGGPENGLDITDNLPIELKTAWEYIQTMYFPDTTLMRCYANSHTFGVEGYPHTDSFRDNDSTLLIYLNRNWKREWGGETMIYDGDTIRYAELPKFNKGFAFNGKDWHSAKSLSRICPELRITLMFKFSPTNCDPFRDQVQKLLVKLRANKIAHGNSNLMRHLLITYDRLRQKNASDAACKAGILHSIFGTEYFKTIVLTDRSRKKIEDLVGIDVMALIDLFKAICRPNVLEQDNLELNLIAGGTIKVTREQLEDLKDIECANLADQSALAKHPSLQSRWTQKLKKE